MATMVIPAVWTAIPASLIPKVIGATELSKFRSIACLTAARKILGYLWMQTLPVLHFETFQTGFVPGGHALSGVFTIGKAAELGRERGTAFMWHSLT